MVHSSSKTIINPETLQKGSFLVAFIVSFALLLNNHTFNSFAISYFNKQTLQKIEAKSMYYADLGLTTDVISEKQSKDLDNSFPE